MHPCGIIFKGESNYKLKLWIHNEFLHLHEPVKEMSAIVSLFCKDSFVFVDVSLLYQPIAIHIYE